MVRDIHIRLGQGEILTLIGPNGAGKSTVLKTIARQLPILEGKVWLGGRSLSEISGKGIGKENGCGIYRTDIFGNDDL